MTLNIIGLGLNDEKDITLKGLELIRKSKYVYLENYTSKLNCSIEDLEKLYDKKIILADRTLVEQKAEETILKNATNEETSFLIIGDPFSATTHNDLFLRAKELKIKTRIINNASILNAIGKTGLQLYKFGKTTSIPKGIGDLETPYIAIKQNQSIGLHTLCLLDIKTEQNYFMTIKEAIEILLKIEEKRKENVFTPKTKCVAFIDGGNEIVFAEASKLQNINFKGLQSLIIPNNMHFMEEDVLKLYKS